MTARLRIGLALLAGVGAAGSAVALLATSAWLIARAAQEPPVLTLMAAIVAVRAFGLGRGVLRYVERLVGHDAAFRVQAEQRFEAYRRLEGAGPEAVPRSGDLLSRLVADVDAVVDRIVRVLLPTVVAGVVAAASAGLLAILLPAAGVVTALAVGLALLAVPWIVRMSGHAAERRLAPLRGELAGVVAETLDAVPELVAFGASADAVAAAAHTDERLRAAEARSAWSTGLGGALLVLLVGAGSVAGLAIGVPEVRQGNLAAELLAVVVLTPLALADVLGGIPAAAATAYRSRSARSRVDALLATPPEPPPARSVPGPPHRLRIEDLHVRTLQSVNLELPPGAKVAVVGPSGSGKTTLMHVLVRFLDQSRGRITLNGVDIRDLEADEVRRIVKLCEQQPYVFDTTLAENLRLAKPDATAAELEEALRAARLLDWVQSLPHGLETLVGEHGSQISGGERQRLGLARCLLADAPIVLYDEPAEHLEEAAAAAIVRDLLAATGDRTVLLATHRPLPDGLVHQVLELR